MCISLYAQNILNIQKYTLTSHSLQPPHISLLYFMAIVVKRFIWTCCSYLTYPMHVSTSSHLTSFSLPNSLPWGLPMICVTKSKRRLSSPWSLSKSLDTDDHIFHFRAFCICAGNKVNRRDHWLLTLKMWLEGLKHQTFFSIFNSSPGDCSV